MLLSVARVHNKRREGEYPTSIVWPNVLGSDDVTTYKITLGVERFDL